MRYGHNKTTPFSPTPPHRRKTTKQRPVLKRMDSSEDEPSRSSSIYEASVNYDSDSGSEVSSNSSIRSKSRKQLIRRIAQKGEGIVEDRRLVPRRPSNPFSSHFCTGQVTTTSPGQSFVSASTDLGERRIDDGVFEPLLDNNDSSMPSSLGSLIEHKSETRSADGSYRSRSYTQSSTYSTSSSMIREFAIYTEYASPVRPVAPPPKPLPEPTLSQNASSLLRRLEAIQCMIPVSTSPMAPFFSQAQQYQAAYQPPPSPPAFRPIRSQQHTYGGLSNHPFHHAPLAISGASSSGSFFETTFGTFDTIGADIGEVGYGYARASMRSRERYAPLSDRSGSTSTGYSEDEGLLKEMWRLLCCFGGDDGAESSRNRS